jgi:hypothetical protein
MMAATASAAPTVGNLLPRDNSARNDNFVERAM